MPTIINSYNYIRISNAIAMSLYHIMYIQYGDIKSANSHTYTGKCEPRLVYTVQTNNKIEDACMHIIYNYSNLDGHCSPSLDRCPLVYTYTSLGILRVYPSSGHYITQANMMDCLVVNCITCMCFAISFT